MRRMGLIAFVMCCAVRIGTAEEGTALALRVSGLNESSGLAPSLRQSGVWWTHNDSGDTPRIFAFDGTTGEAKATIEVAGAEAIDWEDMASFQWQGEPWIVVADVGDNQRRRTKVTLYAFPEPEIGAAEVVRVRYRWDVRYPQQPRNCEGVAVDVRQGMVLMVDKAVLPVARLWSFPLRAENLDVELVEVAKLGIPVVTGLDLSPDGRHLLVGTYADGVMYSRTVSEDGGFESWGEVCRREGRVVSFPKRAIGESVAFTPDGKRIALTTEGEPAMFYQISVVEPKAKDE